jgi:RNA polymerase sigma-B factor
MAKPRSKSPDRQEVEATARQYRRTKDLALRDRLISQHLYLVQTVARRFSGMGEPQEDLLQEGAMGLINAVDLYDPDRGVQFSTYATHLVEGQIRHYLRDKGKLIKQPAWVQELTTKILRATEALTQELNREPTVAEVAARVGTTSENVQRMLEAKERSKVASLDAATAEEDGAPAIDPEKLRSQVADETHLPIEDRIFLREAMAKLKALEREVVHHFYFLDLNQTEIARRLGISVNYASYLLRGAVAKLRKSFEAQQAASAEEGAPMADRRRARAYSGAAAAPVDPVTRVTSEEHFLERLAQELERARRYPQQFAVVLLESDRAELADDEQVALARLLRSSVRSIDLVAGLRACQFGLLLPHTGREAAVLAERLVKTTASRLTAEDGPHTVSVGFGVFPTDGRSLEGLLSAAEEALAEARRQGGNCFVRARGGEQAEARSRAAYG